MAPETEWLALKAKYVVLATVDVWIASYFEKNCPLEYLMCSKHAGPPSVQIPSHTVATRVYAAVVWYPHYNCNTKMLKSLQNRAAHWICGSHCPLIYATMMEVRWW